MDTPSAAVDIPARDAAAGSTIVATLSHSPGKLADVVDVFREHSVNMSRIRSRPSAVNAEEYDIEIDVNGVDEETFSSLITALPAKRVTHLATNDVPWFPRCEADLDESVKDVWGYGAELDADHPGFTDEAYRARREKFAETAYSTRHKDQMPRFEYNEEETATWRTIYTKLKELHPTHACKEFIAAFNLLEARGVYSPDTIPQLAEVSDFLQSSTGFRLRIAPGLISSRSFLNALAFRTFFCTSYIRHSSTPMYTPEPDVCHELLGHVPLFANLEFAQFSQAIGLASLGATDDDIKKLATLYWFTVEFGVTREEGGIRAYGAGLLSSFGELQYCTSDEPEHRPLDLEAAATQEYPITSFQPVYFVADSFANMATALHSWAMRLDRPFAVTFDPYTRRVIVLESKQEIMRLIKNVNSELSILTRVLEHVL
ncbi:phenylalanine-4-hydroxylase [Thecamonas trahens ATCC 50062]|uniref:phenylalanine 4-monooxygenase n=1 Tax=Thecamonas trahens ATCC 50062 TaxID=461836 RepID=A0A0L0DFC6_THETB|nr:phenylalanine-4-hydroxylase [Thecamonas trahens ATCC 50062]KNC50989.1 phenylalanine-4-hydroxylase [Thecamonas trahens ATCC 50062]|eukprot:XP_013756459.1 phenylalanine-4-hydroxylase [Thecamonas trahens ATCC 50062]